MHWTAEAETAIKKVPFFVRKRVRARVESEARREGKSTVTMAEVNATQQRYLTGMASEVKGYQLDACFGPAGCPNQIQPGNALMEKIEGLLRAADLLGFLKSRGVTDLKFHHEFRVTLADCPNACSQPQIKDVGILAAALPRIGAAECSGCEACTTACREAAISLDDAPRPVLQGHRCVACGKCIAVCPTGTITDGPRGYRVQLGGKLGRHPRLAQELPGLYDGATVVEIVAACLELYKERSIRGERFGEVLQPDDFQQLARRFAGRNLTT